MIESQIYIDDNDSEADTCRKDVLPKIYASNWTDEQIIEQRTFSGISAGFGIRFTKFRFDYSYSRYTLAANTSLFGLMINL